MQQQTRSARQQAAARPHGPSSKTLRPKYADSLAPLDSRPLRGRTGLRPGQLHRDPARGNQRKPCDLNMQSVSLRSTAGRCAAARAFGPVICHAAITSMATTKSLNP